jgi:hypothetical protein
MSSTQPRSLFGSGTPTGPFGNSRAATETRHQVQYWLNYNLDAFSQAAKTRITNQGGSLYYGADINENWISNEALDRTRESNGYAGVITANYDNAAAFINRIANKGANTFLDLTPAQQSLLVPHFEVYMHAGSDDSNSSYVRLPITMPLQNVELTRIAESGYGRPNEVGFKSFEWEDQGNAPGVVGIMYAAKLNLFFSSIGALTTNYATSDGTTTFLELISPTSPNRTVGVVVGWSLPPDSIDEIDDYAGVKEAVERQRMAFDLIITAYDMTFTELGGVNLEISYMLAEDARMFAGGLDLMSTNDAMQNMGWGQSERAAALQREIEAAQESIAELQDAAGSLQTMIDIWRTVYDRRVGAPVTDSDESLYFQTWGLAGRMTDDTLYLATVDADGNITERSAGSTDDFQSNDGNYRWTRVLSGDGSNAVGDRVTTSNWSDSNFSESTDYLVSKAGDEGFYEREIHEYNGQSEMKLYFNYLAQRNLPRAINSRLTDAEQIELRSALDGYIAATNGNHFTSMQIYGSSTTTGWLPVVYSGSGAKFRDITDTSMYSAALASDDRNFGALQAGSYIHSSQGLPIEELLNLQDTFTGEYDVDEDHPSYEDDNIALAQEALDLLRQKKPLVDLADMFQNIYDKLFSLRAVNYVDVPVADITGMTSYSQRTDTLEIKQYADATTGASVSAGGGSFSSAYDWNGGVENFESNMQAAEARVTASEEAQLYDVFTDIQLSQLNVNSYTAVQGSTARVCFFYLGDLLSVIYGIFANDMQTVVGPFIYGRADNEPQSCCLADIPINYDSFSEACVLLFRESWARGGRMPPGRFLDYILEQLVCNWKGMVVEAEEPSDAANSVAQTRRASQGGTVDIVQRLLYMEKESDGEQLMAPYLNGQRIRLEEEEILPPFENPFNRAKYYCIYASNNAIQLVAEQPSESADELIPIYWLKYGYANGIVKNIEFSRMDMEGYAEGIAVAQLEAQQADNAGASQTGAQPLAYVFQASITMIGNTLFENGQMVYITPNLPGVTANNAYNMHLFLGLTGYYRVIKTTSVIEDGKFETVIDCIFERARTGEGLTRGESGEIEVEY